MWAGLSVIEMCVLICIGFTLDAVLGEPHRAHPLVAFGRLAERLESRWNRDARTDSAARRLTGTLAVALLVGVPVLLTAMLIARSPAWAAALIHAATLYFAIGAKSLRQHAQAVARALAASDLVRARRLGGRIVSRDLSEAPASEVARAAVESTLENGNDAVFSALFWFAIGGAPGVLAYRLVNTLDAMWGYRTPRYIYFGWAAARLDDAMNYLPARLTALTYAALGDTRQSLLCWRVQARAWKSPNAGPVMASGAGALGLELGGPARYHGRTEERPRLGAGSPPDATDIGRALHLVHAGVIVWAALLALLALGLWWSEHA